MRIVFMGTPEMAVPTLDRVLQRGHQVEAVFTQPDRPVGRRQELTPPPVKLFAQSRALRVIQPAKIKTDDVRTLLEGIAPEIIVVAAYGKILPPWLLEIPPRGCINVHFSLLPKYRGAAPVNWAIVRGETETGVTTMLMDEGMDTGPILLQQSCPIGLDETAPDLAERLSTIGADLLLETLEKWEQGEIQPQPQDSSQATLAPMLKREDGQIDWNLTADEIRNRIRGFQPWPGAWTTLNGQRLILWHGTVVPSTENQLAGTVYQLTKDSLIIACGQSSYLQIDELQLEGKRRLNAREFLNGTRLEIGQPLGQ